MRNLNRVSVANGCVAALSDDQYKDLMAHKPRIARTERLIDWRFFIQVKVTLPPPSNCLLTSMLYSSSG
jgi:hypothetical protein